MCRSGCRRICGLHDKRSWKNTPPGEKEVAEEGRGSLRGMTPTPEGLDLTRRCRNASSERACRDRRRIHTALRASVPCGAAPCFPTPWLESWLSGLLKKLTQRSPTLNFGDRRFVGAARRSGRVVSSENPKNAECVAGNSPPWSTKCGALFPGAWPGCGTCNRNQGPKLSNTTQCGVAFVRPLHCPPQIFQSGFA